MPSSYAAATTSRGLSMTLDDEGVLGVTGRLFDGLYAFCQRAQLGRPVA
jgi:hypothetical protein